MGHNPEHYGGRLRKATEERTEHGPGQPRVRQRDSDRDPSRRSLLGRRRSESLPGVPRNATWGLDLS